MLVELVKPQKSWKALDIATGAGHTALAFAPKVSSVIASDITAEMAGLALRLAKEKGLTNVEAGIADAECLPFDDASFDLITCRLALHHMADAQKALKEMARVLKKGGTLGFTDNVVVDDAGDARYYNEFEKIRDPSHHRVYSLMQLISMFETAGFEVLKTYTLTKEMEFHDWADRQRVSSGDKEKLMDMMRHLPEGLVPLFKPRFEDDTLYFSLWEAVMVAKKT